MPLLSFISNPLILFLSFIIALVTAISIHESAHAWVAWRLGDPTAKNAGRISLNPLVHLDLVGTLFLLLAGFGWGKPVPVNPSNFKNPKLDEFKVALAGPISNFIFAAILAIIVRFIPLGNIVNEIFLATIQFNIILMFFNLLPVPPLDGSSILQIILPEESYQTLRQLTFPLMIAFLFFIYTTPYLANLFSTVNRFFTHLLVG